MDRVHWIDQAKLQQFILNCQVSAVLRLSVCIGLIDCFFHRHQSLLRRSQGSWERRIDSRSSSLNNARNDFSDFLDVGV
jgi:hypothetical protein